MSIGGVIQEDTEHRKEAEKAAIQHGDSINTGTNKTVYRGLRGMVKPMARKDFPEENREELGETDFIAPGTVNERDFTDIGLWEETMVIHQDEADEKVGEAVEKYGTDFVVEETVENLLDEFTERGIVYEDPRDNIGFYNGEAKAFDVYDSSAFEFKDGDIDSMSDKDFYKFQQEAPVMYQKFAEEVASYSKEDAQTVIEKVSQASDYLIEGEASRIDFQQAFNYQRWLQKTSAKKFSYSLVGSAWLERSPRRRGYARAGRRIIPQGCCS